ncbi:hypothetical protein [Roseiflexus sp.]|uniref:hypothetical protein n=1 Tax=Roseiflexus sp. TaxID=2562120 RepID=UPI00398B9F46
MYYLYRALFVLAIIMLIWAIIPSGTSAQEIIPTPVPTVTPWGGRRGVIPGGAAPLFPYWLAGIPIIAAVIALIVWRTRRAR